MASVNLSDIYPEVRPDVPDCMDVIMLNAIRNAAIKFCEKSHAWEVETDSIIMSAGIAEYEIDQPLNQRIIQVSQVITAALGKIDSKTESDMDASNPTWRTTTGARVNLWVMLNPRLVRVYPVPTASGEVLTIKSIVKPSPIALVIDDIIYDDYFTGIAAGAKALLCAMPHKEWTNLAMVPYYQSVFDDAVSVAKMRNAYGYSGAQLRARPQRLGG